MNKPLLSFVYLSALALACPVTSAIAEPTAANTSTEAADRKFLANLENAGAPKAPAETAPAAVQPETASPRFRTEATVAPARPVNPSAPVAKTDTAPAKEKSATARVAKKKVTAMVKPDSRERTSPPAEIADDEGTPVTPVKKTTTTTIVVQPLNDDRDGDHDHDRDAAEHHHFFHRLFAHVFNQQHPEDW